MTNLDKWMCSYRRAAHRKRVSTQRKTETQKVHRIAIKQGTAMVAVHNGHEAMGER